jgi:hypothetical protein
MGPDMTRCAGCMQRNAAQPLIFDANASTSTRIGATGWSYARRHHEVEEGAPVGPGDLVGVNVPRADQGVAHDGGVVRRRVGAH